MKANSLKTKISPRRRGADEVAAEPGQRDHELALVNPYPRKRLRRQIQRPDWIVGAARVIDSVRQAPFNGRISLRNTPPFSVAVICGLGTVSTNSISIIRTFGNEKRGVCCHSVGLTAERQYSIGWKKSMYGLSAAKSIVCFLGGSAFVALASTVQVITPPPGPGSTLSSSARRREIQNTIPVRSRPYAPFGIPDAGRSSSASIRIPS